MPIIEQSTSRVVKRSGKNSRYELRFLLQGYSDSGTAIAAMTGADTSLIPESVSVDGFSLSVKEYGATPQGNGVKIWIGTVEYSHPESSKNTQQNPVLQETGDVESSIDYGLKPRTVRLSLDTSGSVGFVPSNGRLIGQDLQTGYASGTSVGMPYSMLNYTKVEDAATVTDAFIVAREDLMGSINSTTFKGRPAETVRFIRMNLRQRAKDGPIHITYGFERQRIHTIDLSEIDAGSGSYPIYPYRVYDTIYQEEPETINSKKYMVGKAIGFVEHKLAEIPTADFSIFGV